MSCTLHLYGYGIQKASTILACSSSGKEVSMIEQDIVMPTQYKGKAIDMIPVNIILPKETYNLLSSLAPNRKGKSSFITQLIHTYEAQQVERLQWREKLATLMKDA
jgi:hypothetical protein